MANQFDWIIALTAIGLTLRALMPWLVGLIVYFASGRDPKVFEDVARLRPRWPGSRS